MILMKIIDINIVINISHKIRLSSTSAGKDAKWDTVSRLTKMIFWRVLLPIIISHRDTLVPREKVFYSQRTYNIMLISQLSVN